MLNSLRGDCKEFNISPLKMAIFLGKASLFYRKYAKFIRRRLYQSLKTAFKKDGNPKNSHILSTPLNGLKRALNILLNILSFILKTCF